MKMIQKMKIILESAMEEIALTPLATLITSAPRKNSKGLYKKRRKMLFSSAFALPQRKKKALKNHPFLIIKDQNQSASKSIA